MELTSTTLITKALPDEGISINVCSSCFLATRRNVHESKLTSRLVVSRSADDVLCSQDYMFVEEIVVEDFSGRLETNQSET